MSSVFPVQASAPMFDDLEDVQVVFHGINKSGSKAMTSVIRQALHRADRSGEILSHYHDDGKGTLSLEDFIALVDNTPGKSFAVGHYLYGALKPRPRRVWVTQFRHPLPRIVSAYHWMINKQVAQGATRDQLQSLTDFVRKSRGLRHSQLIQLGRGYGRFSNSAAKRALPPKALFELSIEAIEREFTAIAVAEHFEESIFCFARLAGLAEIEPWQRDNRNKNRPLVDELQPEERDLIREFFKWDFKLYDYALSRFHEQNARIDFGPSLADYKAACSGEYKDRLVGSSADEAMNQRFANAAATSNAVAGQ